MSVSQRPGRRGRGYNGPWPRPLIFSAPRWTRFMYDSGKHAVRQLWNTVGSIPRGAIVAPVVGHYGRQFYKAVFPQHPQQHSIRGGRIGYKRKLRYRRYK